MSTVQTTILTASLTSQSSGSQQKKNAGASDFDALLTSISTTTVSATATSAQSADLFSLEEGAENFLQGIINQLIDYISGAANDNKNIGASAASSGYPFSSEFESTFGTTGPLPAFITEVSVKLNMTKEQNLAFQQIAVNNKDATRSVESRNKIAKELEAAGISYGMNQKSNTSGISV
jgi:hypothetical protein